MFRRLLYSYPMRFAFVLGVIALGMLWLGLAVPFMRLKSTIRTP
jgi:hypothetical protein